MAARRATVRARVGIASSTQLSADAGADIAENGGNAVDSAIAAALVANEDTIVSELNAVQGQAMDIGGYYAPNEELASAAMRPSSTLNALIADFVA